MPRISLLSIISERVEYLFRPPHDLVITELLNLVLVLRFMLLESGTLLSSPLVGSEFLLSLCLMGLLVFVLEIVEPLPFFCAPRSGEVGAKVAATALAQAICVVGWRGVGDAHGGTDVGVA